MPDEPERRLAKRRNPVSGEVEEYQPEDDDPEAPSAADVERFGDVTVKCPECGTELFDDVAVCWKCGRALTTRDTGKGVPVWAIAALVVVVAAFLLVYVVRLF
jgi:uncharacterized protein (DUF983 family)